MPPAHPICDVDAGDCYRPAAVPSGHPIVTGVDRVQDLSRVSSPIEGFLRRFRHRVKSVLSDGTRTESYVVDYVDRTPARRDAVCVLAYVPPPDGGSPDDAQVLMRRQMRYPVHLVAGAPLMLEAVAGIREGPEPVAECAARELWEEAGLRAPAADVVELGAPTFPSPGILTERIHLCVLPLPPGTFDQPLPPPPTDGTAMEAGAEVLALTLGDALSLTAVAPPAEYFLADAKTELALHRLRAHLREAAA